ncbi:MAG: hypothetical protein ACI4XB_06915, partial [Ruminococcus sp.]
ICREQISDLRICKGIKINHNKCCAFIIAYYVMIENMFDKTRTFFGKSENAFPLLPEGIAAAFRAIFCEPRKNLSKNA